jgi:membrane protease YdiL (CAAX protease family)
VSCTRELEGDRAALDRLDDFEDIHQVVRLREDVDALRTIYAAGPGQLTEHQRQLLIDRHHWFGRLAVSYGLPNTDPVRLEAIRPAGRSVLILMIFFFLGGGALLTGIVLAILTIVLAVQRRIVPAYQPPPRSIPGPLVEASALYLLGMVTLSQLLARLFPQLGLSLNFFLFALLPLALLYLRVRGVDWREMREALGWRRGRGFWREVGVGLFGYLAGLPLLAIGFAITYILMRCTGNHATHPIANQPVDRPIEVLQIFILACIGAPIIEETMFRGALLGHLRARLPWWISAPIVSLIFAAIHPQGWVAIPVLGSIALVLAWLREWRGSLIASMTAHAFNNMVAVLLLVLLMG